MIRNVSLFVLAATATLGVSFSADACLTSGLRIRNVTVHSDGTLIRTVIVKKPIDPKDPSRLQFSPINQDQIKLLAGDEVLLNSSPTALDALFQVSVRMESQDRDETDILSTTYHIVEISTPMFGGKPQKASRKAYLATIRSNYQGDGKYARDCGEVTKVDLDLESSGDVR